MSLLIGCGESTRVGALSIGFQNKINKTEGSTRAEQRERPSWVNFHGCFKILAPAKREAKNTRKTKS